MQRNRLFLVSGIIFSGFVAATAFHWVLVHCFGLNSYPWNTFLGPGVSRFEDFFTIMHAARTLHPYSFFAAVYFPFAFILAYPFALLNDQAALVVYETIFIVFVVSYVFLNLPKIDLREKIVATLILTFACYPFLLGIDRGDNENLLFIFVALFIYCFIKKKYLLGAFILPVAIALKAYPALFLLLYLEEKRFKEILLALFNTAVLTLGSAAVLHNGIYSSFAGLKERLEVYNYWYVLDIIGLQHSLTLFTPFKVAILLLRHGQIHKFNPVFVIYYLVFACLFLAGVLWVWIKYDFPLWKKIFLLVAMILLLPQVSFDHKLLHIYIPLLLFINYPKKERYDMLYCVLFGLLLIPKDYIILQAYIGMSISSVLNPMILLAMVYFVFRDIFAKNGSKGGSIGKHAKRPA
jgi:hypothetical protein